MKLQIKKRKKKSKFKSSGCMKETVLIWSVETSLFNWMPTWAAINSQFLTMLHLIYLNQCPWLEFSEFYNTRTVTVIIILCQKNFTLYNINSPKNRLLYTTYPFSSTYIQILRSNLHNYILWKNSQENLLENQEISLLFIILYILLTFPLFYVLTLWWENRCWSRLGWRSEKS